MAFYPTDLHGIKTRSATYDAAPGFQYVLVSDGYSQLSIVLETRFHSTLGLISLGTAVKNITSLA